MSSNSSRSAASTPGCRNGALESCTVMIDMLGLIDVVQLAGDPCLLLGDHATGKLLLGDPLLARELGELITCHWRSTIPAMSAVDRWMRTPPCSRRSR